MTGTLDETDVFRTAARVREISCDRSLEAVMSVAASPEPVVLKGFVRDWPVVKAGASSLADLQAYLARFDRGVQVPVSAGPATLDGRIFYNADMTGMNVDRGNAPFTVFIDRVFRHGPAEPPPLSISPPLTSTNASRDSALRMMSRSVTSIRCAASGSAPARGSPPITTCR